MNKKLHIKNSSIAATSLSRWEWGAVELLALLYGCSGIPNSRGPREGPGHILNVVLLDELYKVTAGPAVEGSAGLEKVKSEQKLDAAREFSAARGGWP